MCFHQENFINKITCIAYSSSWSSCWIISSRLFKCVVWTVSSRFFKVFIHSFCVQMMVAETNFKCVLISTLEEYVFQRWSNSWSRLVLYVVLHCVSKQGWQKWSVLGNWLFKSESRRQCIMDVSEVVQGPGSLYRATLFSTILCPSPFGGPAYQGIQFNFQVWAWAATVLAPGGSMYRIWMVRMILVFGSCIENSIHPNTS